ncbi:TspO/MBR family protein [Cobetia sp. L2A1]|uniref:TspO/MBR family protein n=1 Tax=Cobetia sp. L2A1 TaxID=2686360 RepID=UPI00131B738C|nr:TspO/MBR family protein [Cobetia sp. L2A1]
MSSLPSSSPARSLGQMVLWFGLCFATAAIGAIASVEAKSFYSSLTQPGWAPPAGAFGPVWTTLFVMMAIAAWRVARESKQACDGMQTARRIALGLFVVQLVINALWSWLFFAWQMGAAAFADVLLLWALIAITLVAFWRIDRLAGLLMVPYLLWVTLASALTWSVWQANPALLG